MRMASFLATARPSPVCSALPAFLINAACLVIPPLLTRREGVTPSHDTRYLKRFDVLAKSYAAAVAYLTNISINRLAQLWPLGLAASYIKPLGPLMDGVGVPNKLAINPCGGWI